jgi:hypothetical protein
MPWQMRRPTIMLLLGLLIWRQAHGQLILTQEDNNAWEEKLK